MASTYEPIATQTLGAAASSITFSSIPSTYTDIVAVFIGTFATSDLLAVQMNGDTAANYSTITLTGTSSNAVGTQAQTSVVRITIAAFQDAMGSTVPSNAIVNFDNYSNSTTYKTVIARTNNFTNSTTALTGSIVGTWRSTAAINSLRFFGYSGVNFSSGSTITLYGIKAA